MQLGISCIISTARTYKTNGSNSRNRTNPVWSGFGPFEIPNPPIWLENRHERRGPRRRANNPATNQARRAIAPWVTAFQEGNSRAVVSALLEHSQQNLHSCITTSRCHLRPEGRVSHQAQVIRGSRVAATYVQDRVNASKTKNQVCNRYLTSFSLVEIACKVSGT